MSWGRKAVVVEADLVLPIATFPKSRMCDPRVRFCERAPSATTGPYSSCEKAAGVFFAQAKKPAHMPVLAGRVGIGPDVFLRA